MRKTPKQLGLEHLAFGEAIREALLIRGMKQNALARKIGMSAPYINLVIHGKAVPSIKVLAKIAAALELYLSVLVVLAECEGRFSNLNARQRKAIIALTAKLNRKE